LCRVHAALAALDGDGLNGLPPFAAGLLGAAVFLAGVRLLGGLVGSNGFKNIFAGKMGDKIGVFLLEILLAFL
jgi:hypothetical protein